MPQSKVIKCCNTLQKPRNFNQTAVKAFTAIDLVPSAGQLFKVEQQKDTELQYLYKQEAQTTKTRPRQTLIENHLKRRMKNQNKSQQYLKKKHL